MARKAMKLTEYAIGRTLMHGGGSVFVGIKKSWHQKYPYLVELNNMFGSLRLIEFELEQIAVGKFLVFDYDEDTIVCSGATMADIEASAKFLTNNDG